MTRVWQWIGTIAVFLTATGCGLFRVGEAEYPVIKTDLTDLLSFKKILQENPEKFSFQDYDELFDNGFLYVNIVSPGDEWGKHDFLNRIASIQKIATDDKTSLTVSWSRLETSGEPPLQQDGVNTLKTRKYTITIKSKDGSTIKAVYSGEAIFDVVMNSERKWCISQWRDKNSSPQTDKSFFHPDFTEAIQEPALFRYTEAMKIFARE
ncbi:MAG: hypothetical protein JW795_14800 [Chitinivibrionales bacterium]|nr:hypothetical protein [Chitinivibrionales bacterium]